VVVRIGRLADVRNGASRQRASRLGKRISWLISLTYSLDGLRAALLRGASLADRSKLISVLAVSAVVLLPASLYLLSATLRHARMRGTLSFY